MIAFVLLVIVAVIVLAMIVRARGAARPTIWREYVQYLRSGQQARISFDVALAGWERDAKRFVHRNARRVNRTDHSLCVTSWNVHQWKHAGGDDVSVEQIESDIRAIDADVLCLQEYMPREDIDEALSRVYPHRVVEMVHPEYGNAILSRIPFDIEGARVIDLPNDTTGPSDRRVCVIVEIRGIVIVNTHLEVRNDYPYVHKYRYPQIDTILRELSNDRINDRTIVLCGDFNVGIVSRIDREFHKCIEKAGFTRVPVRNLWSSSIYGGIVDHIYIRSPDESVSRGDGRVYFTNASDHYPVDACVCI